MKTKREFDFSESSYNKFASIQREIDEKYTDFYFTLSDMADGLLDNLEVWKLDSAEFFGWLDGYRKANSTSKRVHKVLLLCEGGGKTLSKIKKALNVEKPDGTAIVTTSEVLEFALYKYGDKVLEVFRGY